MGLPELPHEMGMFPSKKYRKSCFIPKTALRDGDWKTVILFVYIAGVAGFANRLEPWTRSVYSIYWS